MWRNVMGQGSYFLALVWEVTSGETSVICKHLWRGNWHSSCCFVSPGWWMKLLTNICLPSATFPPSAHVSGALPSSTKRVCKSSRGAAAIHCVQSLEQPLEQHCLEHWLRYLEEQGCAVSYTFGIQEKVLCEQTTRTEEVFDQDLESWLLLMDPGLEHQFSAPGGAVLNCVTQL